MPQFKITATAPTTYQLSSLRNFGLPVKSHLDGSHTSQEVFDTEKEAKAYLIKRAELYYDEFEGQADGHLQDIEEYGQLTIDAVTAHIEEV